MSKQRCRQQLWICLAIASFVEEGWWSAADSSSGSGSGEPGQDEVAFELGERAEEVEHELAAGGGGVDVLGERPEADLAVRERGDGLDELA